MNKGHERYEAIVIGASSGGLKALRGIITGLPDSFELPIIIVQHIGAHSDSTWINTLKRQNDKLIKEADEKERIENSAVYVAPPNYHLMIEQDKTFSLNIDERVHYARPSIDVLFESAAEVYKDKLIGIILTGSGKDGAQGLKRIKEKGGLAIVQDPVSADSGSMPAAAIASVKTDYILSLVDIRDLLTKIACNLKLPL